MDGSYRPLIGIPAPVKGKSKTVHGPAPHVELKASYAETIAAFGGVPLIIPACFTDEQLRAAYGRISGLLLPGGGDLDPRRYGAAPAARLGEVDVQLDEAELTLAGWAIAEGKPILGLCRGAQMLNVVAGGTLIQDLPTERPSDISHQQKGAYRYQPSHEIDVLPDSLLAPLLGATHLRVNSTHHQAVREIAPGWRVIAKAPDGVVEGIERTGSDSFAVGVQCHPEELWQSLELRFRGLFEGFIQAGIHYAETDRQAAQ